MASKPTDNDVADMLEALARRIRTDMGTLRESASRALVTADAPEGPTLGALDVFADRERVTVTVETRNVDAANVQVSLLDGKLLIHFGECRRDLPLPAPVDEEGAVATFRNGVLDVVLPIKREKDA